MKMLRYLLLMTFLVVAAPAMAQLSLAPTFVYVDSPESVGSIVVTNNSTQLQEVLVDYTFGYPSADSIGHRFIQYDDHVAAARYDLSGWIRSFPQRFRIEPGRRQVVRMLVQPPEDLEDGIYWTRVTITSSEPAASALTGASSTSAQVNFEVKQVIPIVYRKGNPATSAQVVDLHSDVNSRWIDIRAILKRDGDAPFFGTASLRLKNESGTWSDPISTSTDAYFTSSTHFRLEAADFAPGTYLAEVKLDPRRHDVPARHLPGMSPVVKTFSIEIPESAPAVADAD